MKKGRMGISVYIGASRGHCAQRNSHLGKKVTILFRIFGAIFTRTTGLCPTLMLLQAWPLVIIIASIGAYLTTVKSDVLMLLS